MNSDRLEPAYQEVRSGVGVRSPDSVDGAARRAHKRGRLPA